MSGAAVSIEVRLRMRPVLLWRPLVWLACRLTEAGWHRAAYVAASMVRFDARAGRASWRPLIRLSKAIDQAPAPHLDGTGGAS